jgi:hypothetical protein
MTVTARLRAATGSVVIIALMSAWFIMAAPDPSAKAASGPGPRITRAQILARAAVWMRKRPAYSQTSFYDAQTGRYTAGRAGNYNAYRSDCSGFVSMAWATYSRTLWTKTLPSVSHPILKRDLRPGDALLRSGSHVVLFVKWDDTPHNLATVWHQSNRKDGMKESHLRVYGSYLGAFGAIRYNQVVETAPAPARPAPSRPRPSVPSPAPVGYRILAGSPESGNDQCGWWVTSTSRNLRYRSCVHHSVNGWYGGLQVQNLTAATIRPSLFWWDWTTEQSGVDRQKTAPGTWSGTPAIAGRETVYVIGAQSHAPTNRCTAVQGRPIGTSRTETWASSPFSKADTKHCSLPVQWSSPR